MSERIEFPDVVELVRLALLADDITPVVAEVPNPRPASFVRLQLAGGLGRTTRVSDTPHVAVETWAETPAAAHDLAQACRTTINALRNTSTGGVAIGRVAELAGPAYFPDPVAKVPRYTQTFSVSTRGSAA